MITVIQFLLFAICADTSDVPYKPFEQFEIKVDYKFQQRPSDPNKVDFNSPVPRAKAGGGGQLPYLDLYVKLLKLESNEVRYRIVNSNNTVLLNKKAQAESSFKIPIGFIDDVKDRVAPHEFTIHFLSDAKEIISRIHLIILEDGTFLVNQEKRGKF